MRAIIRHKQGIAYRFAVIERCAAAGEIWIKAAVWSHYGQNHPDGETVDYCYLNRGENLSDLAIRWLEGEA